MEEQKCLYPETDYCDQKALHLWTTSKTKFILAYARILPPNSLSHGAVNNSAKIGRVVVDKSARGTGLSYHLMEKAISLTHELYPGNIEISAQAHLTLFYQKFGFKINSEEYLEDAIPHISMNL